LVYHNSTLTVGLPPVTGLVEDLVSPTRRCRTVTPVDVTTRAPPPSATTTTFHTYTTILDLHTGLLVYTAPPHRTLPHAALPFLPAFFLLPHRYNVPFVYFLPPTLIRRTYYHDYTNITRSPARCRYATWIPAARVSTLEFLPVPGRHLPACYQRGFTRTNLLPVNVIPTEPLTVEQRL